jgi:hypothetical protein
MSALRIVMGLVGFSGGIACCAAFNLTLTRIVGDVNTTLPTDQQIFPSGWHPQKLRRTVREYRRAFPDGTRVGRLRNLYLAMFAGLALTAFSMDFGLGLITAGGVVMIGPVFAWLLFGNHSA